jgi:hypothetical protein
MTRCNVKTSWKTRGNQEEKWTRGGSTLQGRGVASRGQEEAIALQQARCDNQQANKRQTGGEASADKRRQSVERRRGGGGTTRGIATTIQKTRHKWGGGTSRQSCSGALKAGGASRQQEVEVA